MLKHNLLLGALLVNVFAEVHILQQNISSISESEASNSTFANRIASALADCSVPIHTSIKNIKPINNSESEWSDHTYSEIQDEPILAAYKRSSFYDNYDSNDGDSNNQTSSNSRNNNNNSDDNRSDSRTNLRGYRNLNSRSNDRNNHSGNNSKDNHGYNDNKDDKSHSSNDNRDNRHNSDSSNYDENYGGSSRNFGFNSGRNSRNDRHGSTDENDDDDDDSTNNNQKDNKHDRNSNESSKNSSRSIGMQHILRRKSRETYNTEEDEVSACTIQCILSKIRVVNEEGFPSETAFASFLQVSISDSELFNFSKQIIQDCFVKLRSDMEEDNCKISKKLTDCLGLEFKKSSINATDELISKLKNQNKNKA